MPERKADSKQPKKQPKAKADGSKVPKLPDHPNLNAGGTPGNRGGGNIKSRIRELSVAGHATILTKLLQKAKEDQLETRDLIALVDKLGKYGVGQRTEIVIENAFFATLMVGIALKFIPEELHADFKKEVEEKFGDV